MWQEKFAKLMLLCVVGDLPSVDQGVCGLVDPRWISAGMCPVSEGTCCCAEAETTSKISLAFLQCVSHRGVLRSDAQCWCCWSLCKGQGSTGEVPSMLCQEPLGERNGYLMGV